MLDFELLLANLPEPTTIYEQLLADLLVEGLYRRLEGSAINFMGDYLEQSTA